VSHLRTDIEISCLPKDLPEALEVDMAEMKLGDTVYLKDIKLPQGVTIPSLSQGRDVPVVSIHAPRTEEPEAVAADAATAAVPTAGDAKKAADAKAGDAKGGDAKKDAGKK
jgi:large subunit ribosomal protein L25